MTPIKQAAREVESADVDVRMDVRMGEALPKTLRWVVGRAVNGVVLPMPWALRQAVREAVFRS